MQDKNIKRILRIEKEEATLYGLHNMNSWNKIKNKYKYFIVMPINTYTIRVVKYTNDRKIAESIARLNNKYILIGDW